MSFVFRLRTRIRCRIEAAAFPATIQLDGFPPIEVSYETEGQHCVVDETKVCPSGAGIKPDGGRYTFIARGFLNDTEALAVGRRFSDLMLAAGATKHMGVDVGFDRHSLQFGAVVRDAVNKATGFELRGDKIGLMTYRDGTVQIARMEGAISTRLPLPRFLDELAALTDMARSMTERQRTCAALLNDSHYAVQDEAVFVLLVSAVEALCDQYDRSPAYIEAVEELETHLAGMQVDSAIRKALEGTLKYAKKQSLRQSFLIKFRTLLDEASARAFDELYNLRSKFVHVGEGRGELRGKIGKARQLGVALFQADLKAGGATC